MCVWINLFIPMPNKPVMPHGDDCGVGRVLCVTSCGLLDFIDLERGNILLISPVVSVNIS